MMTFTLFDKKINCAEKELAIFSPPNGTTCGQYLETFLQGMGSGMNLLHPEATDRCEVCEYTYGSDYLKTVNLNEYYYGWRDAAIVALFAISSYAMVYLLMKLRTKASKKAE